MVAGNPPLLNEHRLRESVGDGPGTSSTQLHENTILGPAAHVVLGATALTMAIIALRWELWPSAIAAILAFATCAGGYIAAFSRIAEKARLELTIIPAAVGVSAAAAMSIPHGTQTEAALVVCLLTISSALVGLSLYFERHAANWTQAIFFLPTAVVLLMAGGTAYMFLIGMMALVSILVVLLQSTFERIVVAYRAQTARYEQLAESSIDDLEAVLQLLHPFTVRVSPDGLILDISAKMLETIGVPASALKNCTLIDLLDIGEHETSSQVISIRRLISAKTAFETDAVSVLIENEPAGRFRLKAFPTTCAHMGASIKVVFQPVSEDPHDAHTNSSIFEDVAALTGGALWETGPDHRVSRVVSLDSALAETVRQAFDGDDGDPAHRAQMDNHHPLRITLGLARDGTPTQLVGRARTDRDGIFQGYTGFALPTGSLPTEAGARRPETSINKSSRPSKKTPAQAFHPSA